MVNDLPIALMCIVGSFIGILVMLISAICEYVEENGDKIIWKRRGLNNGIKTPRIKENPNT